MTSAYPAATLYKRRSQLYHTVTMVTRGERRSFDASFKLKVAEHGNRQAGREFDVDERCSANGGRSEMSQRYVGGKARDYSKRAEPGVKGIWILRWRKASSR